MKELLDKISGYSIINNLIPGAVLCFFINDYLKLRIIKDEVFVNICLFYFIGIIISRVGSIIVEKVCEESKLIQKKDYGQFIEAEKNDEKLKTIAEICDLYRSIVALSIILMIGVIIAYFKVNYSSEKTIILLVIFVLLLVLMVSAYRKQTGYVVDRIKKNLEMKENVNN